MTSNLTKEQKIAIYTASFPFYQDVCDAIDPIIDKLTAEENELSIEALNSSFFGRFFVAIADTFTGLLNTFKTNAFKFTKSLKRSELREFVESNRMKTSVVYKLPYDKLAEFKLDVPANLTGTFIDAVASVARVYANLNAKGNSRVAQSSFTDIYNAITTNDKDVNIKVAKVATTLAAIAAATKSAVLVCQQQFSGKFQAKKPYKECFKDTKEFQQVTSDLIEMEFRLQDANEIIGTVTDLETTIKNICDAVEKSDVKLDQKSVIDLGNSAKALALMFDAYGMAATRQMSLEHNHVLNINSIYFNVK